MSEQSYTLVNAIVEAFQISVQFTCSASWTSERSTFLIQKTKNEEKFCKTDFLLNYFQGIKSQQIELFSCFKNI